MKTKTYVLIISEHFPAYHSRKGDPTGFEEKILNGEKIHTIRQNYELWKKRVEKINKGEAVLSLRKWSGKPRRSKQVEIMQLEKVGIQPTQLLYFESDKFDLPCYQLAKNDGLSTSDFTEWFQNCPEELVAIIHFTKFRY